MYSCCALARLAYARGDWQEVVRAMEPLLNAKRLGDPEEDTYEPAIAPWQELYVEALVALGRLRDAEAVLVPFERVAATRSRRSSMANAARARGRLEAARRCSDKAEEAFLASLGLAEALPIPFDRALTELSYGAFLRRLGRRRDAGAQLMAARQRLVDLRARPYLDRCDRELAACGLAPSKRRGRARAEGLTPQELSVARLVASGLTNRQVACELVVSTKTVEYHLANIYTKLGISSRTQLTVRLLDTRDFPGAKGDVSP